MRRLAVGVHRPRPRSIRPLGRWRIGHALWPRFIVGYARTLFEPLGQRVALSAAAGGSTAGAQAQELFETDGYELSATELRWLAPLVASAVGVNAQR